MSEVDAEVAVAKTFQAQRAVDDQRSPRREVAAEFIAELSVAAAEWSALQPAAASENTVPRVDQAVPVDDRVGIERPREKVGIASRPTLEPIGALAA